MICSGAKVRGGAPAPAGWRLRCASPVSAWLDLGPLGDQLQQLRVFAEEVFADIVAAGDFVFLVLAIDNFHPNPKGYGYMVELIWPAVAARLALADRSVE